MKPHHTGSCLCNQIKFEVIGDFQNFFLCHCKHCQKDTGSAHGANLFSTTAKLSWISGETLAKTFVLPNTRHTKSFCTHCGSALPSLQMNGKLLVVPAGSLDSELSQVPDGHLFCASKAHWDVALEKIKRFDRFPN